MYDSNLFSLFVQFVIDLGFNFDWFSVSLSDKGLGYPCVFRFFLSDKHHLVVMMVTLSYSVLIITAAIFVGSLHFLF